MVVQTISTGHFGRAMGSARSFSVRVMRDSVANLKALCHFLLDATALQT
jgi:hypothetical protein